MDTMTEAEAVERFGRIRFYEILISKHLPEVPDPYTGKPCSWRSGWRRTRTVRCYSRIELEETLEKLRVRAPLMGTCTSGRRKMKVDKVRFRVYPAVTAYESWRRSGRGERWANFHPLSIEEFDIEDA